MTSHTNASTDMRKGNEKPVYISVATSAFSGATLLAFLLGTHPQITTTGEMDGLILREDPDQYLCSCGKRIRECEFWQMVGSAMAERGFDFDLAHFDTKYMIGHHSLIKRLRMGSFGKRSIDTMRDRFFIAWPEEKRRLQTWVSRNVAFIESVLEVTGKRVFVDTSKNPMRLKYLQEFSALDIRAIHLVRDVRGVVNSRLRRRPDLNAQDAARQWVKLNRKLEITLQSLPTDKRIQVRYEDLCHDAQGVLAKLFKFCDVDPSIKASEFMVSKQHIVGNAMRLKALTEIRLDESWKNQLTERQLSRIEREAGTIGSRYGYY